MILSSFSVDDRGDAVDGNLELGKLAAYIERGYSGNLESLRWREPIMIMLIRKRTGLVTGRAERG
ncbi:hypothetical protein EEB12_10990 [Rhodococcus sp. WS1]|nr:hypothetical protein EEB12_10990 [Rhodococcus sp. WS1]